MSLLLLLLFPCCCQACMNPSTTSSMAAEDPEFELLEVAEYGSIISMCANMSNEVVLIRSDNRGMVMKLICDPQVLLRPMMDGLLASSVSVWAREADCCSLGRTITVFSGDEWGMDVKVMHDIMEEEMRWKGGGANVKSCMRAAKVSSVLMRSKLGF